MDRAEPMDRLDQIAIVGMVCRFPGARDVAEFWQNLRSGVESITFFSDEQLEAAGVDPGLLSNPNYVKAKPVLEGVELFDAGFFKMSPREAEILDPQHRLLLECAWEALENAGYDPDRYPGRIGVYAGAEDCTYRLRNLMTNAERLASVTGLQLVLATDRAYLSTRVSYALNLKGPSITVQTSCSTSLVAVHLACESLLNGECDMALAGGVTVNVPQTAGYFYEEGGILSRDGHCRPFDARASGTLFGSGIGVVVLKRLEDALADGDHIYAVILGSAVNNDGSLKVGYTAPSVDGQAAVIAEALQVAGVDPETVTYVEAHGSATELGDPIEISALTRAFRRSTERKNYCAIGSVKSNVGHLATAAGMAGLIKTVLSLQHGLIPPSLHFEQPNPKIDLASSPFYVNTTLREWQTNGVPRRAGVSAFGMGGTNAHIILEEAPEPTIASGSGDISRPWQLLLLSARTESALERATDNLAGHLKQHPDLLLADVAYTLQVGRRPFDYRRAVVCRDLDDAISALESRDPKRVSTGFQEATERSVVFMFPGLGDQYPNMALGLYQSEPTFRTWVDRCAELLRPLLGLDIRTIIFPPQEQITREESFQSGTIDLRKMLGRGKEREADEATQRLNQTSAGHPAVFVIEYALAQLLLEWGIRPQALIGHSVGEYVAACLASVFSLQDALTLVARRAQMIQALPGGAMLAVPLSEEQVRPLLGQALSLSAINGPSLCVVAGPMEAISALESSLLDQGIACRRLQTTHAFHSAMLDPIVGPLAELVKGFKLNPPAIPYLSNLTGTWITAEQATDPEYWAQHSRHPVRFADGIGELWRDPNRILVEVGPGRTLSSLAIQHPASHGAADRVVALMRHAYEQQPDLAFLLGAVGQMWIAGVPVDWSGFYRQERRRRLPLPTYPFERQRYWIEPGRDAGRAGLTAHPARRHDLTDWFYIPSWKRTMPLLREPPQAASRWLLFGDGGSLDTALVRQIEAQGDRAITVLAGKRFAANGDRFTIRPDKGDDYRELMATLRQRGQMPDKILHLWNVAPPDKNGEQLQRSFYSLLFLAQALAEQEETPSSVSETAGGRPHSLRLAVVSSHTQKVTGDEVVVPERATLLGPCLVIPHEMPNITCRSLDVALPKARTLQEEHLAGQIIAEMLSDTPDPIVAYRGSDRWVRTYEPMPLPQVKEGMCLRLRERGVYLITDGLSGIGLALARYLAAVLQARIVLVTRVRLPAVEEREQWLATHEAQDPTSILIRRIQELEALGAQLLIVRADVADAAQVKALVRAAREQFGTIHGVIHAWGLAGGTSIRQETEASAASLLRDRVQGMRALEEALKDIPLDFMVLCSSLAALKGLPNHVVDCAADAFLDAFATASAAQDGRFVVSINWDSLGKTADLASEPVVEAFRRILGRNQLPQIAVCDRHLPSLLQRHVEIEQPQDADIEPVAIEAQHPRPSLPTTYAAPRTEVEEKLAGIWQRLLGVNQVGRNDSFFRLGGHSLVAIQLINRVRDTFQVEMDLRSSFEAPTIAELAERIEQARSQVGSGAAASIQPVSRQGPLPASLVQQHLWSISRSAAAAEEKRAKQPRPLSRLLGFARRTSEPEAPAPQQQPGRIMSNLVFTVRLDGSLDLPALEQSVNQILWRHEALRTTFGVVNGQLTQVVSPPSTVALPVVELRDLPHEEQQARIEQLRADELRYPFDLVQGPLWRAFLLNLGDNRHLLLMNLHRAIADERSVEILLQEIGSFYAAFVTGAPPSLPDLPIHYADFSAWQWERLRQGALDTQLAYWKQQLHGGWPELCLPTGQAQPSESLSPMAMQPFDLSQEQTEALKALSQQRGNTLFMSLLSVYVALLHRLTGQTDVVVGTLATNRNRGEVEGLIGPFGNTLILRTDLSGDPTFDELLGRVREVTLGAYAHPDLSPDMLIESLAPGCPPAVQTIFLFQNEPLGQMELPGLTMGDLEIDRGSYNVDLVLSLDDTGQGLRGAMHYNTARFEAPTISHMVDRFQQVLSQAVANPGRRLSELV